VILPYINFERPEFQRIENWFRNKTITETKGAIQDLNCTINGFQFDFGTGGIHGSVESQVVTSDDEWIIEDWDVASYYPNLAIKNNLAPAHLGETFCTIYEDVYQQRKGHAKGTAENAMLKLALNGVYGDSNSKFSPFYDPAFTMAITVNGQLSLCMLAEHLMKLTSLTMIQINTDGLTVRYPRAHKQWVHDVCAWWEQLTKLELEDVEYSRMFIRDVNNYIGEYPNGKMKRKGAYEYDLGWHQNHSALVVKKAAEAALLRGKDIRDFITRHSDIFDFFLRVKVPRASRLHWGDEIIQNTTRYFISTDGDSLRETRQPKGVIGEYKRANRLTDTYFNEVIAEIGTGVWDERIHTKNKSVYQETITEHNTGYTVQVCNRLPAVFDRVDADNFDGDGGDIAEFTWVCDEMMSEINYEWYIKETEKLVKPLLNNV
jgi:DNA polymerase elongation subunit (family B)